MSIRISSFLIFLLALILMPAEVVAQSPPPATPIDGGLGILLAGGAAYGIRRLTKKK